MLQPHVFFLTFFCKYAKELLPLQKKYEQSEIANILASKMTDEQTITSGLQKPLELEKPREEAESQGYETMTVRRQSAQAVQAEYDAGVPCPKCGTINDAEALYCASCGALLGKATCPNCGSEVDPEADFCESCHHYIRPDVCSFCGAAFSEYEIYCPECGQPRGGIVCPHCHTLNDFSFCKQCGQPLTAQAKGIMNQMRQMPEYKTLLALAHEYNELDMQLPYATEQDKKKDEALQQLRERVLRLLAEDQGKEMPIIKAPKRQRVTKEELAESKKRKLEQLAELFDRMAIPEDPSPAKVRNYAMAQKPAGVRLAWVCNYKKALHSSPCGCAKPQMGGKWVILGHNSKQEIKDDK